MKFIITLLLAIAICASAQVPPAAVNPYAVAFNPYFAGLFGGAAAGSAGTGGAASAAAGSAGASPLGGFSFAVYFQSIALKQEADRLLNQPDFPADLADRVNAAVTSAQQGSTNCPATLPWLQIRCVKPLITAAKNELKLVDEEWQARQAASTTAAPAAV